MNEVITLMQKSVSDVLRLLSEQPIDKGLVEIFKGQSKKEAEQEAHGNRDI